MKILQINNTLRIKNGDKLNWTIEELKISPDTLKSGEANPKAGQESWVVLLFERVRKTWINGGMVIAPGCKSAAALKSVTVYPPSKTWRVFCFLELFEPEAFQLGPPLAGRL